MTARMSAADVRTWAKPAALPGLGEVTAQWLEGRIASRPGYMAECGPEEETEQLIGVLAAANRAGYVTIASQPGAAEAGWDGAFWQQRAAVQGFADDQTYGRLRDVAQAAGAFIIAGRAGWRCQHHDSIIVTTRNGRAITDFGAVVSRRFIRDSWVGFGICSASAQAALCDAWQVTITAPEFGEHDRLWKSLADFAGSAAPG